MSLILRVHDSFVANKVYTFPYNKERKLKFSKIINGGDEHASWFVPCQYLGRGIPPWGSKVDIIDPATGKYRWTGYLRDPKPKVVNGKLVSCSFEANGFYYTAQKDKIEDPIVFGPSVTSPTNAFKVNTTDIADAVLWALGEKCPLIEEGTVASLGINLDEDSASFQNNHAVGVWNAMALQASYVEQLIIWQVVANDDGTPVFNWGLEPSVPAYYDPGGPNGLEIDFNFDMDQAANVETVLWGNTQKWTEPFPYVLDETILPPNFLTRAVTQVGGKVRSIIEVEALAQGLLERFNRMRATDARILVKNPLGTTEGAVDVPMDGIDVGTILRLKMPDLGTYHLSGSGGRDVLIQRMEYDEDGCQSTLSLLPFDSAGRNSRMLGMIASQGAFVHWSIMFPEAVAGIDLSHYQTFGPTSPTSYSGVSGDPNNLRVQPGLGVYVVGAGTVGGVHHPDALPDDRLDLAYDVPSADGGVLTAGNDYLSVPIQPAKISWVDIKAKQGESGTVVLRIDRVKADGTVDANVFGDIALVTEAGPRRISITGSLVVDGIFTTNEGDWLVINIPSDATDITKVSVGVHGKKWWPELPSPPKPDWVP